MSRPPVLGVDPGTRKCGVAVVAEPLGAPQALEIDPTDQFGDRVVELVRRYGVRAIALGGGTHAGPVGGLLRGSGCRSASWTSTRPPCRRGRATLPPTRRADGAGSIPRGMLMPPRPIDDYAALLIAERYLLNEGAA